MGSRQCDVLIVGAGPVGLLLALLLKQNGVDVIVVERQKALYPLPRAVLLDHESRRLFGLAGLSGEIDAILEDVIGEGGEEGINFVWRDADLKREADDRYEHSTEQLRTVIVDLHTEKPTRSGHPFISGFTQPAVEGLLEKTLLDRKIPLIRGYALRTLDQYPDRVDAEFTEATSKDTRCVENGSYRPAQTTEGRKTNGHHTNGTTDPGLHVRASYVVGCDGANSTVRRMQNLSITDLNFESDWLIIDLLLRDGYVPPLARKVGTAQICDPRRPTTCVFGGSGRKRFEFMRLPKESKEELAQDEKMWELLKPWGFTMDNCDLERKVIYTFNARWANESFKGRVALAGDAFHLMPPFIGQGLNSGFRDAGALAWRMRLILSGLGKPEAILQSYQNERLDHIRKLTEHCILLGKVVCETDPVKSKKVHKELRNQPPGAGYDPPLGQPGILTSQPEAGHLSFQRRLRVRDQTEQPLFDDVHGYGWFLLAYGNKSVESQLLDEDREFFLDGLKGQCVNISAEEDVSGEYRDWFADHMELDSVVLIRPDFYIFGHAPRAEVNGLVQDLRKKLGAA